MKEEKLKTSRVCEAKNSTLLHKHRKLLVFWTRVVLTGHNKGLQGNALFSTLFPNYSLLHKVSQALLFTNHFHIFQFRFLLAHSIACLHVMHLGKAVTVNKNQAKRAIFWQPIDCTKISDRKELEMNSVCLTLLAKGNVCRVFLRQEVLLAAVPLH